MMTRSAQIAETEVEVKMLNGLISWEYLTHMWNTGGEDFEKEDNTKGSQELACTAGVCELVDI